MGLMIGLDNFGEVVTRQIDFVNKDAPLDGDRYRVFLNYLTEGKVDDFLRVLKSFLQESVSYFDIKGKYPEKFYHGFVLGLIAGLFDTYNIQSNRESAEGRYDIIIIPKDLTKLGLVMEFKVAQKNITLERSAQQALEQITKLNCEIELKNRGINKILKIGLAFRGKDVEMASSAQA